MTREIHVFGNWKMNQNKGDIYKFFEELGDSLSELKCQKGISPQFIHLPLALELATDYGIEIGAQNCSHESKGAFTGDVSPTGIKDLGASFTLIGHSERRAIFNEDHALLAQKTKLALENGLKVVFCIGETLEEREADKTLEVLQTQLSEGLKGIAKDQLENIILAYEPVWAIGTGKVATPEQAEEAHQFIRQYASDNLGFSAEELIILYGGSVKPSNAEGLFKMSNIDGGLVGGASLIADDYLALCKIAHEVNS